MLHHSFVPQIAFNNVLRGFWISQRTLVVAKGCVGGISVFELDGDIDAILG